MILWVCCLCGSSQAKQSSTISLSVCLQFLRKSRPPAVRMLLLLLLLSLSLSFLRRCVGCLVHGVWEYGIAQPRNIVINEKTCCSHLQGRRWHKDGDWVFFETSASTTSRDPNVNVTTLRVSWWIRGGAVHGSPLPPFESLAYAYMCILLIVFFLHVSDFIFCY